MKAETPKSKTKKPLELKSKPKRPKEKLVEEALQVFGGRKSYYQHIRKEHLEAALSADEPTQVFVFSLIAQLGKSARNNQRVNGRRLNAENQASRFEGVYKEELQRRTHLEVQHKKVLGMLKQLLEVENSELLKASRLALQTINKMIFQK